MAAYSVTFTRNSPFLSRFTGFSRKPISPFGDHTRILANPTQIREFRSCLLCYSYSKPLNSSHGATFNDMGRHGIGFGRLGSDHFRVSAVSDCGSGGTGGYGGSGGWDNGGSGEGGGNGDEKNWSLLSWYLGLLAKYPVAVKAVTSALLTLIGDLICQISIILMHRRLYQVMMRELVVAN